MRRISSTLTFYYKRVFPVIWFGGLVLIGGIGLYAGLVKNTSGFFPFLIVLPIMFVPGTRYMKKLVFDLVDEVWDFGDQFAFSAPVRVMPLMPSAEIADLIDRVDAARKKKS
jgi:hypothetical protein